VLKFIVGAKEVMDVWEMVFWTISYIQKKLKTNILRKMHLMIQSLSIFQQEPNMFWQCLKKVKCFLGETENLED